MIGIRVEWLELEGLRELLEGFFVAPEGAEYTGLQSGTDEVIADGSSDGATPTRMAAYSTWAGSTRPSRATCRCSVLRLMAQPQ